MARPRPARTPLALVALEDRTAPAMFTWTGGGGTNNFSDKANWGGTAPATNGVDDLVFPASPRMSPVLDISGPVYRSITFTASGYAIGGFNGFSLSAGG